MHFKNLGILGPFVFCLGLGFGAYAQAEETAPSECHISDGDLATWTRCLEATEPGTTVAMLAHANLGTIAFRQGDTETALYHYDFTIIPDQNVIMDVFFHAFRGGTFHSVGRIDEALEDADRVLQYMSLGYFDVAQTIPLTDEMRSQLYAYIIPTLAEANVAHLDSVVETYLAIPTTDWIDTINRAAVFIEIDRLDEGLVLAQSATEQQPNHPATQNTMCYVHALMGNGEDALPYCVRAMELAPNNASIIDSYAVALSVAGRCDEAIEERERTQMLQPSIASFREPLACETQ